MQDYWDKHLSRVGEKLLPLPAAKEMLDDPILLDSQLERLPTLDQVGVALIEFHDMLRSGWRFIAPSAKFIEGASETLLAILDGIAKQDAARTSLDRIIQDHSRVLTRSLPILICAQMMASAHPHEYPEPTISLISLSDAKSSIDKHGGQGEGGEEQCDRES